MIKKETRKNNFHTIIRLFIFCLIILSVLGLIFKPGKNSADSITGFEVLDSKLKYSCNSYFGDVICDDSPLDCSVNYEKGVSIDVCNECQTEKNGKRGFDTCGGSGNLTT